MSSKYELIDAERVHYPIVRMCDWTAVSTSGCHEWRDRPTSATARRRDRLRTLIEWIFDDSDRTHGHRRTHAAPARRGESAGPESVRAILREPSPGPCRPQPWRPTTTVGGHAGPTPDLPARNLAADAPGTKLVGDITYIPTWAGRLHLATVTDCHTKACIGYALATAIDRRGNPQSICGHVLATNCCPLAPAVPSRIRPPASDYGSGACGARRRP